MLLRATMRRIVQGAHTMQQFIPFEDDWDALENLRPEALIPFRLGLLCKSELPAARTLSSIFSATPGCAPIQCVLPVENSGT
jgi:hypothetical protein